MNYKSLIAGAAAFALAACAAGCKDKKSSDSEKDTTKENESHGERLPWLFL